VGWSLLNHWLLGGGFFLSLRRKIFTHSFVLYKTGRGVVNGNPGNPAFGGETAFANILFFYGVIRTDWSCLVSFLKVGKASMPRRKTVPVFPGKRSIGLMMFRE